MIETLLPLKKCLTKNKKFAIIYIESEVRNMGAMMAFVVFTGILSVIGVVEWIVEKVKNNRK